MTFGAKPEMAPLSGIDEYLIHNYPAPQRIMYTSDPRAFERTWHTAQDKKGELMIVCGVGFYPNLNTADAYGIVICRGKLRYVRFSRRLGLDRTDMKMGPLNWEIVEPFKTWRLTLDDNEFGIKYDILWHDNKRPIFSNLMSHCYPGKPPTFKTAMDDHLEHVGYEGFGRIEGWCEFEGERFELTTDTFNGSRDHHWGARNGVGGIGAAVKFAGHSGQWVEFEDWSIWGGKAMHPWGSDKPAAGRFFVLDRQIKFDPDTREFREAIITIQDEETGASKQLHYRRLGYQTAYLRCGGYGDTAPDEGGTHGVFIGDDKLVGGQFNLQDAEVRKELGDLVDHHCEVTCEGETTYGLLECFEPLLYGLCEQGAPGFRFME